MRCSGGRVGSSIVFILTPLVARGSRRSGTFLVVGGLLRMKSFQQRLSPASPVSDSGGPPILLPGYPASV